ncbi:MAG: phage tail tape measure protein [Balneola sp.]|nr:phage tail tape measure protein [Balneola sp.]|tara:strand:+ start:11166 stop:13688 length:2523 start_codon:yes stop_codon:yes gene_type:complete
MSDRRVTFVVGANVKNFVDGMGKVQKRFERMGKKMQRIGSDLSQKVTLPILGLGAAVGKTAIDFESAFAGVRKTVDATEEEFGRLRQGILDMSKELPTSANEIAGVAEAAGQLGIKSDAILEFTKTMVMLGDTTDIVANDAAKALARVANILQLPQDRFDEMGSTIVDLGNNFATTESEIVDMSTRIAAAGNIAKMSASDIFAISTALSSVGVNAESGGTAAQKGILAINDAVARGGEALETFAKTSGMSAHQFRESWRQDAGLAFSQFIQGLGSEGDNATQVLEDVGLQSERTRAAFLSLANSGDLLNRTIETGRSAWEENNALTKEAQQRYETMASDLSEMFNSFKAAAASFQDVISPAIKRFTDYGKALAQVFEDMEDETKKRILVIAGLLAASGPLLVAFGGVMKVVGLLASTFMIKFAAISAAVAGVVVTGQWFVDNWDKMSQGIENITDSYVIAFQKMARGIMEAIREIIDFVVNRTGPGFVADVFGWDLSGWVNDVAGVSGAIGGLTTKIEKNEKELAAGIKKYTDTAWGSLSESAQNALDLTKQALKNGLKNILKDSEIASIISQIEEKMLKMGGGGVSTGASSGSAQQSAPTKPIIDMPKVDDEVIHSWEELDNQITSSFKNIDMGSKMSLSSWQKFTMKAKEAGFDFVNFLSSEVAGAISSFAEGVGEMMAGAGNEFSSGLQEVMLLVLDFAKKLGGILTAIGTAIAFIPGLQGPAGLYIAGGSALTMLAAGGSAAIQKNIDQKRENAQSSRSVNDAIISPNGNVITTHPEDYLIATKNPGYLAGQVAGGSYNGEGMEKAVMNGMQKAFRAATGKDLLLMINDYQGGAGR